MEVMEPSGLADRLRPRFTDVLEARGEVTVTVSPEELAEALAYLRETQGLGFRFLSDVTASDWPGKEPRFWLAYELLSMEHRHRVRVNVGLPPEPDPPHVPSATALFPEANWLEREVYDFFGIVFDGHPDLRRIEMPEDWVGHPLRKDQPLAGVNTQYKGAFIPPPDERGW
jgi:NADH-quinone oxidoreductase subunit C